MRNALSRITSLQYSIDFILFTAYHFPEFFSYSKKIIFSRVAKQTKQNKPNEIFSHFIRWNETSFYPGIRLHKTHRSVHFHWWPLQWNKSLEIANIESPQHLSNPVPDKCSQICCAEQVSLFFFCKFILNNSFSKSVITSDASGSSSLIDIEKCVTKAKFSGCTMPMVILEVWNAIFN